MHGGICVKSIAAISFGTPQMWERAHVGFGGTGRKRKGPWHETMRLAEARLVQHAPGGNMPS